MQWDLYDKNFQLIGKTIEETEADEIPNGLYHMTVNVWIINSQKQVLLIKKVLNFNLRYPGLWTSINGNVIARDKPINCVKKSVKDKIGIEVETKDIIEIGKDIRDPYHYIFNTFVILMDIDSKDIKIKENFGSKVKWADIDELENMMNNGEIEPPLVSRIEKYIKHFL